MNDKINERANRLVYKDKFLCDTVNNRVRNYFVRSCIRTIYITYSTLLGKHAFVHFSDAHQFHYVWGILTLLKLIDPNAMEFFCGSL